SGDTVCITSAGNLGQRLILLCRRGTTACRRGAKMDGATTSRGNAVSVAISRHFVTVSDRQGRRQVHYRRAGTGPAILLLHQSPQSSTEMEPLMADWGRHFTLIAPDSPGYGWSDPLATKAASLADFADATLSFADAIGLRRFGVYGFHT